VHVRRGHRGTDACSATEARALINELLASNLTSAFLSEPDTLVAGDVARRGAGRR
jgi:hypothetical protein